ncbi:MAPK protein hog1, partial [Coelomomyces lativittatus]
MQIRIYQFQSHRRKSFVLFKEKVHQILIITERLGTPPQAFIDSTRHESTKAYLVSIPPKKRIPFQEMFPDLPLEAIDLLDRMLVYEAEKRVTAKDALRHPYLEKFHDPSDEPDAPVPFDWEKIRAKLSIQQWR